jgi:hypothetical protein
LLDARSGTQAITILVEAELVQRGQRRIDVDLNLRNDGIQPVRLLNPFETVQFIVLDADGFPKRVPRPVPSLLINRKGQAGWKLRTAVPVVRVLRDGHDEDPSTLDTPVVSLRAGGSFQLRFGIDHFEAEPDPTRPAGDAPGEAPRPGVYTVQTMLNLINADDTNDSRVVQSGRIQVRLEV